MTNEEKRFTEQAVNRVAEIALARLLDAEQLMVRIKTSFNQLIRGEIEAIVIDMSQVKVRQDLRVEALRLKIGRVVVKPRKAALGKIELVEPSQGNLQVVFCGQQLTAAFNSESFRPSLFGKEDASKTPSGLVQIEQIQCEIRPNRTIALTFEGTGNSPEVKQSSTVIATPRVEADGQTVALETEAAEPVPSAVVAAVVNQLSDLLSLRDLSNRGTVLHIQQLDLEADRITVYANATIEQFPST